MIHFYAVHELKYSPSDLRELHDAPKPFKAWVEGIIEHKLDLEAEKKKKEKKGAK
nr:hypothetical protein [Geomicrobium sp. JCM 19039]